jgi:hypothetical protein
MNTALRSPSDKRENPNVSSPRFAKNFAEEKLKVECATSQQRVQSRKRRLVESAQLADLNILMLLILNKILKMLGLRTGKPTHGNLWPLRGPIVAPN